MLIKKKLIFSAVIALAAYILCGASANAQDATSMQNLSFQNNLKSILGTFTNVRFSSVSYYEINDRRVNSLKKYILKKEEAAVQPSAPGQQNTPSEKSPRHDTLVSEMKKLLALHPEIYSLSKAQEAFNYGDVSGFEYLTDFNADNNELATAYAEATAITDVVQTDIYKMYLITMQPESTDGDVPEIIALVYCTEPVDKQEYELMLIDYYNKAIGNSLSGGDFLTYPELVNFTIEDSTGENTATTNLYDKLVVEFRQGNCIPVTAEVRGIGTELQFVKNYGKSKDVISNENDIQDRDVQSFLRISEGQPFDYTKPNEIVVGPDLISYKRYEVQYYDYLDSNGNTVSEPYGNSNDNLPKYGAEIKFGMDEINYPSFYSDRMMLRAVWDNIRLGVVLPTSGWSSLSEDLFSVDRRLTHASVGVSGAADFPIKVIPNSGIFSVSGSYVFGDASEPSSKNRGAYYEENGFPTDYSDTDNKFNDYLIRYTAQLHYTFGFAIDESYLLRFGVGATVYGAERWRDYQDTNTLDENDEYVVNYQKAESETIGGISLKADFMSRDIATPFGATLQYFDESLYGDIWLQVPIVQNTFFARIDVQGYVAAFKNNLHPWEDKGVFMPSLRLIFNF
jgi:hypothetical protein